MRFYKPEHPFFGRNGVGGPKTTKARKGAASIRRNFEEVDDSDNEEELLVSKQKSPGPGAYMTHILDTAFHSRNVRPSSLQMFNCGAARFNHTSFDSGLGPDHYKPRDVGKKYNSVLKVAGSAAFKSSKR